MNPAARASIAKELYATMFFLDNVRGLVDRVHGDSVGGRHSDP